MRNICKHTACALVCAILLSASVFAGDRGTAEEAKKMVDEAVAHIKEVGTSKAFADFNAQGNKWHNKDLYIFAYKFDGTNVVLGYTNALVGKNCIDLKSADGQFLIRNMIELAQTKGQGWIDYQWPHPITKKTEHKRAYVVKIPGYDGFIGSGIYPGN